MTRAAPFNKRFEIRAFENMNPLPDKQGDIYLVPLNMVPANNAGKAGDLAKQGKTPLLPARSKTDINQAFQPVFRDAITRIVKRERADIMRQFSKKPENLRWKWLDDFYEEHKDFVRRNISPAIESFFEINGNSADAKNYIDTYTDKHITNSVESIRSALGAGGDTEKLLTDTFDTWENIRSEEILQNA